MPLNPQFVQQFIQLVSQPACLVEISMNVFFPEKKQEFTKWAQLRIHTTPADVYTKLQELFPEAPLFDESMNPDDAFTELLKIIWRKAMEPKSLVLTSLTK